ncbi:hypothetical protein AMJ40_04770 [candidate division TA06 bacterium DG_26]|uniref:NH(3)-dependent NAD(+) synthetase n=1 Tax=candidate division TA06 bacterium DG_26 TaxID=1703771 RepID=A0A0S7WI08_UNCT6|nr:MAG: hypothetical protein AMJ40_04770 [candidate division TA06 bacterium DG_26]
MRFGRDILVIDCEKVGEEILRFVQKVVSERLRKGVVIGLSGGIDSSVTAGLCVKALGKERVVGLILPEKESSPMSLSYAQLLATRLGIETESVDISPVLEELGVYDKRETVVKRIFPEFDSSHTFRLILPQDLLERERLNIFSLEIMDAEGRRKSKRLNSKDYLELMAATDMKQRTRMTVLYYYAEKNNYVVMGTTNKSEVVQGFFVKYGDGGVDAEPIAHLYKTQVYQLAEWLNIPEEIIRRTPSPDTFSSEVSDKEFYFCIPYEELDLLLYAWENDIPRDEVKRELKLTDDQLSRVISDIERKYRVTEHLRMLPPHL